MELMLNVVLMGPQQNTMDSDLMYALQKELWEIVTGL